MKNRQIIAAGIMLMLPLAIQAQENIKKAFDVLIKDDKANVSTTHKLNKDPKTGKKEGQLDVYEFTIPLFKKLLVTNIENAFEKDQDKAYSINSGSPNKSGYAYESIAVGGGSSYMLGNIKGSRYIFASFIDPQDKEKNHRYLYAMEWKEGESEIEGKLVITYATTAQYRSQQFFNNAEDLVNKLSKRSSVTTNNKNDFNMDQIQRGAHLWLAKFQMYKNWYLEDDTEWSNKQAINIYELCKDVSPLNAEEKKLIIGEIQKLRKKANDELMQKMFDMSIEKLKK